MSTRKIPVEYIDDMLAMRRRGLSCGQIAYKLRAQGITASDRTVAYICAEHGVAPNGTVPATTPGPHDEAIAALRLQGLGPYPIAKQLGLPYSSVRWRLICIANYTAAQEVSA